MNSVPVFNLRPPVEMRTGHVDATLDGTVYQNSYTCKFTSPILIKLQFYKSLLNRSQFERASFAEGTRVWLVKLRVCG